MITRYLRNKVSLLQRGGFNEGTVQRNEGRRERRARENLKGSCFTLFWWDVFNLFQYLITEK